MNKPIEIDDVLTVEEVAALSKRSVDAIRKASERGEIPGKVYLSERVLRFDKAAIAKWLKFGVSVAGGKGRESASE